jgi:hypothetical protein
LSLLSSWRCTCATPVLLFVGVDHFFRSSSSLLVCPIGFVSPSGGALAATSNWCRRLPVLWCSSYLTRVADLWWSSSSVVSPSRKLALQPTASSLVASVRIALPSCCDWIGSRAPAEIGSTAAASAAIQSAVASARSVRFSSSSCAAQLGSVFSSAWLHVLFITTRTNL